MHRKFHKRVFDIRKFYALLVTVMLCIAACPFASAAETTYEFPEVYLSFTLPDGWLAATQDPAQSEELAELLETSAEEFSAYLKSSNVYLDSINYDALYDSGDYQELFLFDFTQDATADIYDYNRLEDDFLLENQPGRKEILERAEKAGSAAPGALNRFGTNKVYYHKQAKFIAQQMEMGDENEACYGLFYGTVMNGKGVGLILRVYRELTDEDTQLMERMVERISFMQVTEKPKAKWGPIIADLFDFCISAALTVFFLRLAIRSSGKKKSSQNDAQDLTAGRSMSRKLSEIAEREMRSSGTPCPSEQIENGEPLLPEGMERTEPIRAESIVPDEPTAAEKAEQPKPTADGRQSQLAPYLEEINHWSVDFHARSIPSALCKVDRRMVFELYYEALCKCFSCTAERMDERTVLLIFPKNRLAVMRWLVEKKAVCLESDTARYGQDFHELLLEAAALLHKEPGAKFEIKD